jgi:hypothetical protein
MSTNIKKWEDRCKEALAPGMFEALGSSVTAIAERYMAAEIADWRALPDRPVADCSRLKTYGVFNHFDGRGQYVVECGDGEGGFYKVADVRAALAVHSNAAHDVLAERQRQVSVEGYAPENDDGYSNNELQRAAMCYLMVPASDASIPHAQWPWAFKWWKPATYRRNLVKAGALILAEIERLDRAAQPADDRDGA